MRKLPCLRFLMVLSMLALSTLASAYYFFDQGLQTAVVRTDYNATNEGTSANPITVSNSPLYSCPDTGFDETTCVNTTFPFSNVKYAPSVYSQAFPWSFNGGNTASEYWVLSLNNENWYKHDPSYGTPWNPGAPNLSLPRVEPGYGIMGFKPIIWTEGGENFYRFHVVINQIWPNPLDEVDEETGVITDLGIPFMSIGAADNRGNGGVLGYMNYQWAPSTVEWTSKVWDVYENSQLDIWASSHMFIVTAEWGGKTRMIQIALYHESDLDGSELHWSDPANGDYGQHYHWNWQTQESFWYPGADGAFMDAEDMYTLCGFSMTRLRNEGESANYSVVLDDLFRCASDLDLFDTPMPTWGAVPITGVHWANEGTGSDVALWTSVHNMKMLTSPSDLLTQFTENYYPPVAAAANEVPNEVSLIAERLRLSCMKSAVCWEENQPYIDGKLRDRPDNPNIYVGTLKEFISAVNDAK